MSLWSLSFLFLLSIVLIKTSEQVPLSSDGMCDRRKSVLCVRDELILISSVATKISRLAADIELAIKNTKNIETLNHFVDLELNFTKAMLPSREFHEKFVQSNNIDQKFFVEILTESHKSMLFFYNSIDQLRKNRDSLTKRTDEWFEDIQRDLQRDVICRYRAVLNVYSQDQSSKFDIEKLEFSERRIAHSIAHQVQSIVIARHLYEWMSEISSVINQLETKYF